ncbi:MAG TPA: acetyl-CoA acetyltransferase [Actinomycetota bacterium]|nr:acetyl-CoA acetyltransferase [Actinomycetota bacterium]
MALRVGVAGIGWSGFSPTTEGVSYKELMFEAARGAYADAGLDPRSEIDSFVCCSEDIEEGTSIFDEYVPDQLGAVQRPVQTVASDGLFGLATAVMLIRSGVASTVAVEAHSKASDIVTPGRIDRFAMDPVLNRPLGLSATALAGLEMRRWLHVSGQGADACAAVAARNREHARTNRRASYADVRDPTPLFDPLTREQVADPVDGCVVLVLTSEERTPAGAVFVDGVGWSQDAPSVESRDWDRAAAAERAARAAYDHAGIEPTDVEVAEVDDTYAYKQLQHLEALGLRGLDDERVNRSGGALGEGHLREANGLARALACVERLRAGEARVGLAQSWRGVPSTSAAVAVMRR